MKSLGAWLDNIEDALAFVAAALIVFAVLAVTIDVVSRFFFTKPLAWVFEVAEYILLIVPCIGMAWLARNDGHVMIDIVTARLSQGRRMRLATVTNGIVAMVCEFIAWWGAVATYESYVEKAIIENILSTPQYLIYSVIPFGFALCGIEFARKTVNCWRARNLPAPPQAQPAH